MSICSRRQFLQAGAMTSAGLLLGPDNILEANADKEPKFRLGLVTYNVAAAWDLPTVLQVCQKVGIASVELRTTHKHGVEPTLTKTQRSDVRKRFQDSGVVCWGSGSVCEFHAPDQTVVTKNIETCKQFASLVADIGGKGVKVRPNGLPAGVPVEKTLEQIGKALLPCGKEAANLGVEIWVEVHGRGTAHPPHVKTMMDHCSHPSVGITWNSNADDIKNGSVSEYFQLLKPYLKSCHINDLENDARKTYPYRELFRLMKETGYDRYTLCEYGKTFPEVDKGEEFLRNYKALWTQLTQG